MARLALIADIHGNCDALAAVLADVGGQDVDRVVCLGDVVGYGPDPERCVELVYESCHEVVLGNHDEGVLLDDTLDRLNDQARRAIDFTRERLTDWHRTLLKLYPFQSESSGVALAHGSFGEHRYDYLYSTRAAGRAFAGMPGDVGAVGHTHIPSVFTCTRQAEGAAEGGGGPGGAPPDVRAFALASGRVSRLPGDRRVIVNPGSVGQPRDRNPLASWAILDTEPLTVEVRRVAYDVESVSTRIRGLGLPAFHAERLLVGA